MISKVFPGHSFKGAILYTLKQSKEGEIIDAEGVRAYDKFKMIQDFMLQHQQHPEKKLACFHSILTFPVTEKLGNELLKEIAQKYLEGLKITNTQYVMVKHSDTAHDHIHIIANLIDNNAKVIADNWIGLRGKKEAQKLTSQYKLQEAVSKNLTLTHQEKMREHDQERYRIYGAVTTCLESCSSLKELEQRLLQHGIETLFKYKGQTTELQGISFKVGKYMIKGSKVDRKFSLGSLQKSLALQQKTLTQLNGQHVHGWHLKQTPFKQQQTFYHDAVNSLAEEIGKGIARNIYLLLRPEFVPDSISPDLLREARKKRKRKGIRR